MSPERKSLDIELSRLGLNFSGEDEEASRRKNLITELRAARRIEMGDEESKVVSLSAIGEKIHGLSARNKQIEESVKMEIIGLSDKFFQKAMYRAMQRLKGDIEPADKIIREQIIKVGEVIDDVVRYDLVFERKLSRLERRYDGIVSSLIKKHQETREIGRDIVDKRDLLARTQEAIEGTEDVAQRLRYARAQREIRKSIISGIHRIKLNDSAIGQFKSELPILDGLGNIASAYSYTLKGIAQESELMRQHLEVVTSLYLDMMRTQKANLNLDKEISGLFRYTRNMAGALNDGARLICERANSQGIIGQEYVSERESLEALLDRVETATFGSLSDFESRLAQYSQSERRLE